ncbi:ribonuclease H-like domain-containing protein [Lasiosphaeris hirsuta]|uniref:Ribonuclease H-like domain-containing protein n=1 Tax=Lasiosphaeris hirsuta TaxID=260670 RepID=A0AA40DIJ5_9PEZI|nr:ribonuclease H-like domain-containing protein [Lasiosphaeris hirsuta]
MARLELSSRAFKCTACAKSFATETARATHALAKADHHYCQPCNRCFGSATALDQHRRDSRAHTGQPPLVQPSAPLVNYPVRTTPAALVLVTPARQQSRPVSALLSAPAAEAEQPWVAPPASPAIPAPFIITSPILCRGNVYSRHPPAAQSALYDQLVPRCHTLGRLKLEKYALEDTLVGEDLEEYHATPRHDLSFPKRKAVVLDCEMVGTVTATVTGGRGRGRDRDRDEVVALSVIDFFTGEVIINSLVKPQRPVDDWRSAITGVTPAILSASVARGKALQGREGVRAQLWQHVDENTVLVGHSLSSDLKTLRVLHTKIVDSAILTAEPVFGKTRKLGKMAGLEKLCRELLGLRIRGGALAGGGCAHDSLEDVLAARELVMWCLQNPKPLQSWAARNWNSELNKGRKKYRMQNRSGGGGQRRQSRDDLDSDGRYSFGSDQHVERWEDVVDYELWPKSPPDWSD